ncbi:MULTISPECIES: LemA family protein [Gardnerella]|uniref:LemA family protein n=1 Tax=Gardnerella TaxID=2701 RepID=UPI000C9FD5D5|nr:LemA family protein [Gardnerella sp. DNF01162]PNP90304.1 LemA family protein [Gardnerella sp. DNF01162]RFD73240.1 LemA family protein [Gardnerella vaginalis]RFT35076.1 LemA family protein [Bifidobacteriaceae bacterium NR020]RIY25678.1 LemA family protein [Bifidobacteriaceae bacterium WP021]
MGDIMGDVMDKNTVLICVAIVLVVLIVWFIGMLNRLRKYRVIIEESRKNVDIALAKRYDTICQMLKVAQSFAKYEKTTLVDLVSLREGLGSADSSSVIKNQNHAIGKIFALAEAYPELKSSEQFLNLQEEINDENEQLAAAKRIVNSNISTLNQNIVTFPVSLIASLSGIKQMAFLDEDNLSNKKNIDSILS